MASKKTKNNHTRTLGPIPDLERHLPVDWWRTLFNSVYLKTDGDVVENDRNTVAEIDTIVRLVGLEPNDRILDLCCGQGRHSLELAQRGFSHVTGLDRSRYLIRLARQRASERNINVSFREGDARRFRLPPNSMHCVLILGNSFGYFEQIEDDLKILESCQRVLMSGGSVVLDITNGDWMRKNFEPRSWEWIDQNHIVCRERSLSDDGERLISREVVTHAERGVIIDQFYAERLYNEEALRDLLAKANFENIRLHGELKAESDRGHDLGMMGTRLLMTADAPKTTIIAPSKNVPVPKVTVILGDPRLPDTVKLGGKFNPEDFETIKRLKQALSELDGYEFSYMDNHAALLGQIRSEHPEFVLNLCDEGFNNNAFYELHVPAYLEMLGIPYSGGDPTCLGLCYNKSIVRSIAETLGVPVPLETVVSPADQSATLPATFPALVKPNYGDSSIGITQNAVVNNPDELVEYLAGLRTQMPDCPILVQEFLSGKEYSMGIVGNPGLTVRFLPILEVDYSDLPEDLPQILGYESKWMPDSPYWTRIRHKEADIRGEKARMMQDHSMLLFERLGCRDYARFDYRADSSGQIKLLEVNPNPGWCWDGKLNYMAGFAGMRYADLMRRIIEAAQERLIVEKMKTR